MNLELIHLIFAWIAVAISCAIILKPIRTFALLNNVVDAPDFTRKFQNEPVPYLGGIGIFVAILLFLLFGITTGSQPSLLISLTLNVFIPAFLMLIVGLIDDLFEMSANRKLALQVIVSIIAALMLVSKETVGSLFFSQELNLILSVLWILFITNSVNLLDNSDGIVAGVLAISTLTCAIMAYASNQLNIASLSIVISGACLGFLFWNHFPAKMYLGDAGSLFLGILLAVITIRLKPENVDANFSPFIVIFIAAIPILDTSIVILSRIQRGISPMIGGRDHIAHRLRRVGYSQNRVALILWTLTGYFNLSALALFLFTHEIAVFVILANLTIFLLLFYKFWQIPPED